MVDLPNQTEGEHANGISLVIMSSSSSSPVPDGHVWLVLLQGLRSSFYLEIPSDIIGSLCLKPLKYLLFLGWCILSVEGVLALEPNGEEIDTDEDLDKQGMYYFVAAEGTGTSFHVSEHLCHTIWPTKILPTLSTSRSSRSGRTCLRKLRRRATNFAPICWTVIPVVCGQELVQTVGLVCTSFPICGVPKCVLQSRAGKISDRLPSFCYFSGFGLSLRIVRTTRRM
jgi:hypothetical protein